MELVAYAGYEIRKWFRDSLSAFMLTYFVLMGLIGRYLVPLAERQLGFNLTPYYHVILVALMLFASRIIGAVAGFSILDDRDDNIMLAVKVAPMTLEAFIGLKLALIYSLSVVGGAFVLWFSQLVPLQAGTIWSVAAVAAFGAPLAALLINCLASNKIEGFAAIKGLNTLVILPIVALFMRGAKEFIFAFEPGFWPAKALSVAIAGSAAGQLSYATYLSVGLVYAIGAVIALYAVFKRRV
ncbi:MAG: ABC transporter permease [Bacillota bacterium]|nr:ABC transporter permease [Bacillota bacterium]